MRIADIAYSVGFNELSTLVVFLRNVQTSRLEIIVIFIYQVLLKENKILFVCARQRS